MPAIKSNTAAKANAPITILRRTSEALIGIAAMTFLFSASFWLVAHSPLDQTLVDPQSSGSLLLAAASLALFVLSNLITLVGIVGWQSIRQHIGERVAAETVPILTKFRQELKGSSASVTGYILGQMSLENSMEPVRPETLHMAVDLCRSGYAMLRDSSEGLRLMALNNFVFYSALQKRPEKSETLIAFAKELRDAGELHNVAVWLLTYCRVIALCSKNEVELHNARETLIRLKDSALTPYEKSEAQHCLGLFSTAPKQSTKKR